MGRVLAAARTGVHGMAELTRRGFLQTGVVTGAASISTLALGSGIAAAAAAAMGVGGATVAAASSGEPVAAYVRDPRRGELSVAVGSREVTVKDPDLVGRILRAAH